MACHLHVGKRKDRRCLLYTEVTEELNQRWRNLLRAIIDMKFTCDTNLLIICLILFTQPSSGVTEENKIILSNIQLLKIITTNNC